MDYQDLLCSLFESRHKAIVNKAVGWWNVHMSSVYLLVYPVRVKKVLSRLREIIDVKLPGLPDSGDNVRALKISTDLDLIMLMQLGHISPVVFYGIAGV